MADVPKDLLAEIKTLEEAFTIDTAKLKAITKHFVSELEKGLWHSSRNRELERANGCRIECRGR